MSKYYFVMIVEMHKLKICFVLTNNLYNFLLTRDEFNKPNFL